MHVESYVKISRCVENVYVRRVENHIENRVEVQKKTPSHFLARVEIERQISFFSFGFARVTEARHIVKPSFLYTCLDNDFFFISEKIGNLSVLCIVTMINLPCNSFMY